MDEIVDNLWLSGIRAAVDDECLAKNNIGYVLTALRGPLTWPFPQIIHYQVELDDTEYDDLLVHLPPAIAFIEAALKSGKGVLVHCMGGISAEGRSPSIVAAYLMYSQKVDVDTALIRIQAKRPIPGSSDSKLLSRENGAQYTQEELASAEHMMHSWRPTSGSRPASELDTPGSNSDAPSSPLAIAKLSEDIMRGLKQGTAGNVPPGALGVEVKQATLDAQLAQVTPTSPSSNPEPPPSPPPFPMRTTRTIVPPASRPPVQRPGPRRQGGVDDGSGAAAPPSSLSPPVQDSGITPAAEVGTPPAPMIDPACSGYFVEPMKWMEESSFAYGQIDGRILCPNSKCGAKLGNYAWAGVRCSCGEWVTPGFCIHKTRVDELWN
ncbi:hypothetical protein FRC04_012176 [Tulasnella sp. 424]|nr:hypothetical protein FRC04_012176 [Tulasnella sp. 424]